MPHALIDRRNASVDQPIPDGQSSQAQWNALELRLPQLQDWHSTLSFADKTLTHSLPKPPPSNLQLLRDPKFAYKVQWLVSDSTNN